MRVIASIVLFAISSPAVGQGTAYQPPADAATVAAAKAAAVCKLVQGGSEGLTEQRAYLTRLKKVLL